jgi:hypothetical protein
LLAPVLFCTAALRPHDTVFLMCFALISCLFDV